MATIKSSNGKKWVARVSYRDDSNKIQTKTKTFDTKREAKNFEVDFRRGAKTKINNIITLDELFEVYIEANSVKANKQTIAEKRRIKKVFFEELSRYKMNKITKKKYLEVWLNISKSDYSVRYRNKGIALLKSISNFAYLYYGIEDNAKLLKPVKNTLVSSDKIKIWNQGQFDIFLDCVETVTLKAFFRFLYYSGARRGEAIALQKSDLNGNSINISKSMKHFKHGFTPLKTNHSARVIQIDKVTLDYITRSCHSKGPFIFGGETSLGISTIQRSFARAKKKSGVPDIRLHDLRHSHASFLLNKGANIVAVSRRLGHSDVSITLKVYTHLMQESEDELLKLLD